MEVLPAQVAQAVEALRHGLELGPLRQVDPQRWLAEVGPTQLVVHTRGEWVDHNPYSPDGGQSFELTLERAGAELVRLSFGWTYWDPPAWSVVRVSRGFEPLLDLLRERGLTV